MADLRGTIGSPPEETVRFFRSKGYAVQANWDELWQEEHGRAFTVTKMLNGALLNDVRASLDKVLSEGGTFEQWKADILPRMQAAGWHGRVEDAEITGTAEPVFIGERRLRTIYDTNLRVSRAAGQWKRIQDLKRFAPFLMYSAVRDTHTRPLHRLWGGLDDGRPIILPVDHPAWSVFFPPCGWGCRCGVSQLSQRDLDRRGLRVTSEAELVAKGWMTAGGQVGGVRRPYRRSNGTIELVPAGVDPGFAYNPGEDFLSGLDRPPATGPLPRPAISPDPMPPPPPPRRRPAAILLPEDASADDGYRAFMEAFQGRATDGITALATDRMGEPLVVGEALFQRGAGSPIVGRSKMKTDRVRAARLLAETLLDPDEIWWSWDVIETPRTSIRRLSRRYVAQFEIEGEVRPYVVVMTYGEGGWHGVTAYPSDRPNYINSPRVRGGQLGYRRA